MSGISILGKGLVAFLTLGVLVIVPFAHADADSAFAADNRDAFHYGSAYDFEDVVEARQKAIDRCRSNGGRHCQVIVSCEHTGYGSLSIFHRGAGAPVESVGVVCGAENRQTAARHARRICEYRLARSKGLISIAFEDTSYEMIRNVLAKNCGGGNCMCTEHTSWRDTK